MCANGIGHQRMSKVENWFFAVKGVGTTVQASVSSHIDGLYRSIA